jgi:peptide deformylase
MYRYRGIGLAAPQLGILERVVIADIGEGLISMINPEIITGFGENFLNEGCLSLPEIVVNIKRQESIFVRYLDKNEKESEHELTGLAARVIQHELDHLDGVLIIDYESVLGSLKTNLNNQLKY